MLSSLNAFSGLSAANILVLFGTNSSPSSSSSASASVAQSTSTTASGIAISDPTTTIKALLAQAQIGQAQSATLGGGSTTGVAASITEVTGEVAEAPNANQLDYLQSQTVEAYLGLSAQAQQLQAESFGSSSTTSAPSAPASGGTSGSTESPQTGQPVLLLTIRVEDDPSAAVDGVDGQAETQAQQLVSAFENGTLSSSSDNGSGFSYIGDYGPISSVVITGTEISNWGSAPIPDYISSGDGSGGSSVPSASEFQDIINQSSQYLAYANSSDDMGMSSIIPIGN